MLFYQGYAGIAREEGFMSTHCNVISLSFKDFICSKLTVINNTDNKNQQLKHMGES